MKNVESLCLAVGGAASASLSQLPRQSPPVTRAVVRAAMGDGGGVEASDNDHNTDTERDVFFVKIT